MISQECKNLINIRADRIAKYIDNIKAGIRTGNAEYIEEYIGEAVESLGATLKYLEFCERSGT